ncbi:MAG: hypothetical protein DRI30_04750 [Chloroflexi bacterium]|nr:MAG: hypothetical protein DRI30_04750 [Chloroflexota bacterium]
MWQEPQLPNTLRWSTVNTGLQLLVVWQSSQMVVVWMCIGGLPVATMPLWHEAQLPTTLA